MVACFYIQAFSPEAASHNELYTAIYLSEPTASVLTICIAVAASVDQAQIVRTVWRSAKGRNAIVDDDVVANIPEGQDMQIAITNIRSDSSTEENSRVCMDRRANRLSMNLVWIPKSTLN